ncbi:hypothetical protein BH10ACI2_BH10ACI2_24340 [soil metagenome]
MADAKNKTQITEANAQDFLGTIADEQQRADSLKLDEIMQRVTGEKPKMWGPSIVGYGLRHLKYDSGREMDWMVIGFSPRKSNLTLYVGLGNDDRYDDYLARLGKHKTGKGCLYINKLSNIDETVLEELISASFNRNREKY